MSTEQGETGTHDDVSRVYKALSSERAPEHLNRAILRQAAAESQRTDTSEFRFASWVKPLAWTATVAFSLAIVLEVTELDSTSTPDTIGSEIAPTESVRKDPVETAEAAPERSYSKIRPAEQADAMERAASIAKPMLRKASPAGCDAASRETPEDWLACIQELRKAGAVEQAEREYEAYLLEFPRIE